MSQYDAIVIGSGAAGGIIAGVLAEAGRHVLLLERGKSLAFGDVPRDHLRNHRMSLYGQNTGPDLVGNPRVFVDQQGREHVIPPNDGAYSNNAVAVGGGTRVYGAMAFRFMPEDFRMASIYGVPQGSSLADWPISYDDLEPYYDKAEWEIGVGGDSSTESFHTPRRRGFPMPPVARGATAKPLERAAKSLGWSTFIPPMMINTVPRAGREACIQCSQCVGFACPTEAKNGTHNTMIPRALATGRCKLVTEAMVEKIIIDANDQATGVSYFVQRSGQWTKTSATAKAIIVSAGAVESPRILLNSACGKFPYGLGNNSDHVGRHMQGHYYPNAFAVMPEIVFDGRGPGPTIATTQFNHHNPGVVGGGLLADDFIVLPIIFWKYHLPPGSPRWGKAGKDFMREHYRRVMQVKGPIQEIPDPNGRVTVASHVKDKWGIPVAKFSGTTHIETVRVSEFLRGKAEQWLRAAGATKIWSFPAAQHFSAGQHQSGTCRMSDDESLGVTDRFGRVHGQDRLFVCDASLHVTNGGFNPVLTIMALAFRTAERILQTIS